MEVCRETEDIRQAAAELPWVRGPDVLLACSAAEARLLLMPASEALLSAKFFGEGGLFSQTARS